MVDSVESTKAYATYLSSLGPSLRYNGLLATLLQYQVESEQGKQKKGPLLTLLTALMRDEKAGLMGAEEREALADTQPLEYAEELSARERRRFQEQLERAATALKLAIRTHPLRAEPKSTTDE